MTAHSHDGPLRRLHAAADGIVHPGDIASRFTPHGQPLDIGRGLNTLPDPTRNRGAPVEIVVLREPCEFHDGTRV